MDQNTAYLFVYGTLLQEGNPFAGRLKAHSVFYSPGKIKGLLYDIGDYPGAILTDKPVHYVYGSVYVLNRPAETLRELDDYEGFGENYKQPNEFIRQLIVVATAQGPEVCWGYLYNLPVEGFRTIASGRYLG